MKEQKYIIEWDGPFDTDSLKDAYEDSDYKGYSKAWTLYALTDRHPLYGSDALIYIGKTTEQGVLMRLTQHEKKWWEGQAYLGAIFPIELWDNWSEKKPDDAIVHNASVSRIEELLIYSLAPAYNSRNKNNAKKSSNLRVLNLGQFHSIPSEISGFYNIEKVPEPETIDKKKP